MTNSLAQASTHGRSSVRALLDQTWLPAVLVLFGGILTLILRPAIPLDETRYLEVLRESLGQSPWLLHLAGEPYPDKPPLLFWLARMMSVSGLPAAICLRLLPAISSALTVHVVGVLGRRQGFSSAAWFQAALLLPLAFSQFVLFDSLLTLFIWCSVLAWSRGNDKWAALFAALALLAKGPVVYLFLAVFFWAFALLRPVRKGDLRRALVLFAFALWPLAAWALLAAHAGGDEFARELLWNRWAGRVQKSFAHVHPAYFYLPIVAVGALPGTLLLFSKVSSAAPAARVLKRVGLALLLLLAIFSAMSGKQPHYLLPAMPALALWFAGRVQLRPLLIRRLRWGAILLVTLLAVVATAAALLPIVDPARYLSLFEVPPSRVDWFSLWALTAIGLWIVLFFVLRRTNSLVRVLQVVLVAELFLLFPLHRAAAAVATPWRIESGLSRIEPHDELALHGSERGGLYNLLTKRDRIPKLETAEDISIWLRRHPGGYLIIDERLGESLGEHPLHLVERGRVHGQYVLLLRSVASS